MPHLLSMGAPGDLLYPDGRMTRFISVSDGCFRFEGRIDWRDTTTPVLIWQGTEIETEFEGGALALRFGAGQGVCFFDLEVDGVSVVIEVSGHTGRSVVWPKRLSEGKHRLRLFKRTEAAVGHVAFLGIEIAEDGRAFSLADTTERRPTFQFFGDSITAGACNEDGAADQWENYSAHNNALSYAALTAQAFAARYRNVAVSGMGVVTGYTPFFAAQIWNRFYADPTAPLSKDDGWAPEFVFVNYGENDDSFSKNQGLCFPANFTDRYVALVREMRSAYPMAVFVLLRGGMWGGAKSEPLREAWTNAMRQLEAGDPRMHHFVFQHWSELHPRVSDHRAMAAELTAWLKRKFTQLMSS